MANKPGRPTKPADKSLTETFLFRLSPQEKQAFQDAADLAGQQLSPWMRERLRRMAQRELEKAGRSVAFAPAAAKAGA
jgi:uncharacterized protein (DUF1778 family)